MKYIKLFEGFNKFNFNKIDKETILSLGDNRRDFLYYIYRNWIGDNKEKESFYKDFFLNLRGEMKDNLKNGVLNDNPMEDDIIITLLQFFEFSYREDANLKKNKNMFSYVPGNSFCFNKMIRFIYDNYGNGYHFYDLGSGLPIKALIAQEYGYDSKGFEISEDILNKAIKYGLSDIIEYRDITNITDLPSPKIIYYFNPIYKKEDMAAFEDNIISNMKTGDILLRSVLDDVDSFIGLDLKNNSFSEKNKFNSKNKRNSELSKMDFIHKMRTSESFYWSIWMKK